MTFDDASAQTQVQLEGPIQAGKVVVDSQHDYVFAGPGSLASGSLAVVGGGSLNLDADGHTYAGPTRVSHATLRITGDVTGLTGPMIVADQGTLVMDSRDASTMASRFEVWPTGVLVIGDQNAPGQVFPLQPTEIVKKVGWYAAMGVAS